MVVGNTHTNGGLYLMKSLKEIMDICSLTKEDDLTIIRMYLEQDGMLTNGINLLTLLCKKQSNDLLRFKNKTTANLSYPSEFYYKNYSIEIAYMLDYLTRKVQLDLPFSEKDIEWVKTFDIKKVKQPFWHDLYEAMMLVQNEDYEPKFFSYNPRGTV